MNSLTVGVLLSRVRIEEKLLLEELERRGIATKVLDDRELVLTLDQRRQRVEERLVVVRQENPDRAGCIGLRHEAAS